MYLCYSCFQSLSDMKSKLFTFHYLRVCLEYNFIGNVQYFVFLKESIFMVQISLTYIFPFL